MELSFPFKATCVDDKNRPNEIPINKWVKEGEKYTVIGAEICPGGILAFTLEEIDLSDCFPYRHFAARRFAIHLPAIDFDAL